MKKTIYIALSVLALSTSHNVLASGSYNPAGGGLVDEDYNRGKAIVSGRIDNVEGCKGCHGKFSRSKLQSLGKPVSQVVTSCEAHKPCYKASLNDVQLRALDAYFTKRYNLR